MSAARAEIMAALGAALGRGAEPVPPAEVTRRLAAPERNPVPARTAGLDRAGLVRVFAAQAAAVDVTLERAPAPDAVPHAVAAWLTARNLPARALRSRDPLLEAVPWAAAPMLEVRAGVPTGGERTGITSAAAGIAETGTLMMLSGARHPSTLNFLPEVHIVVLPVGRIVAAPEDAWDLVRRSGPLPRTVNMVTGPSRSGDIEQTILLGAHGPRRLHVVLVDGDAPGG